jgi:hypothetical protein
LGLKLELAAERGPADEKALSIPGIPASGCAEAHLNLCASIRGMEKKRAEGRRKQPGDGRREGRSTDAEWE